MEVKFTFSTNIHVTEKNTFVHTSDEAMCLTLEEHDIVTRHPVLIVNRHPKGKIIYIYML